MSQKAFSLLASTCQDRRPVYGKRISKLVSEKQMSQVGSREELKQSLILVSLAANDVEYY
jgi:hypothetical protein